LYFESTLLLQLHAAPQPVQATKSKPKAVHSGAECWCCHTTLQHPAGNTRSLYNGVKSSLEIA
jgi:hypothetical protein